jgi:drug/metabolite transporter (DMT)-like permease
MRPTTGTVVSLAAGVLLIGTLAVIIYGRDVLAFSPVALLWFAALGVINYPLGRYLNFVGVRLAGVGRAAPILSGAPLVAVTLGVLVGGESVNLLIGLGTATILGGVVLVVTARTT